MPSHRLYSHHARRALTHARLLVIRFAHQHMDTGHLLLGVLLTEGSIGCKVLQAMDLDAATAANHLQRLYPAQSIPDENPPSSEALKMTLELAAGEAEWLGHHYIGTEHFLLALTRSNAGEASHLLKLLNTTPEAVRSRVRRVLDQGITAELELQFAKRRARLSELSRRVINAAEQTAVSMDHPTVGIGHLLLVLLLEKRSSTSTLLLASGLGEARLSQGLARPDPLLLVSIEIVLSKVVDEVERVGSHYTGTDHLLLTLTSDANGRAMLQAYGVDPDALRERLLLSLA